jgi:MtfA peptidase
MDETTFPLIIIAIIILYSLISFKRKFGSLFLNKEKKRILHDFYSKRLNYYNHLPEKGKERFLYRAFSMHSNFTIVGRGGFEVTEEVKLFVLAAYIQLTLGIRSYSLPIFRTIIIYPDSYKNPFTGKIHDGEVNPRGVIVLSWKRLVKGYENPTDCINLGLHEMAHALKYAISKSKSFEYDIELKMSSFTSLSMVEIDKMNSNHESYLRNYAGTNSSEFFAVAVEHFFESPVELRSNLPKVYNGLVTLLKQDPAIGYFGVN